MREARVYPKPAGLFSFLRSKKTRRGSNPIVRRAFGAVGFESRSRELVFR